MVGDGDTVGVGTEIAQGMLRTSEGSFAVDDPIMAKQLPEPGGKDLGLGEELEVAMEAELALGEGALQSGHELTAKHSAQHFVGKKGRSRELGSSACDRWTDHRPGVRNGHGDEVGASDPRCAGR